MHKQSSFNILVAAAAMACVSMGSSVVANAQAAAGVELSGLKIASKPESQTGRLSATVPCNENSSREWSELLAKRVQSELGEVFAQEMKTAYGAGKSQHAVKVAAELEDIDLQVCNFGGGAWTGEMRLRLTWDSTSSSAAKAHHKVTTTGSYAQSTPTATAGAAAIREALRVAVRKLTENKDFAALSGEHVATELALAK